MEVVWWSSCEKGVAERSLQTVARSTLSVHLELVGNVALVG